jgi:hypothetical protein
MTCEHEDCRASLGRDPGYVYYSPTKKRDIRCCPECWAQGIRRDNRESSDKKIAKQLKRK